MQFFIKTFGCQMNVSDSDTLSFLLRSRGGTKTENPREADVLIVNTCSVRERAETKALHRIREYGSIKKAGAQLWVVGCMSQRRGESLRTEIPHIDTVIGAVDMEYIDTKIDALLGDLSNKKAGVVSAVQQYSSFVPVMRGCNNYCSYCIVPYVRGDEHSLPADDIISTIEEHIFRGVREVTLLGQNVNSYTSGSCSFSGLLEKINALEGIERIRFTTSHPKDISDELINAVASLNKVAKHIHLPIQSGCDAVLKKMNRKYSVEEYLEKITKIRRVCPDIDITTDVMVGFPGETEKNFMETLSVFKKIRYTSAFMFAYSPREGTPAWNYSHPVDEGVKKRRLNTLISLQTNITKEIHSRMVGSYVEALLTYKSSRGWIGQDFGAKRVFIDSDENLLGKTVRGRVAASTGMTLVVKDFEIIS
ncbi:MAG: tRNA (N6-isopentenyl adenosine(37)-C2)-methylthiotransferase MiaB [Fibrobacterota bacterium]